MPIVAATALTAGLLSAIAQASGVRDCAAEAGQSAQAFVRDAFDVRSVTLDDGTPVSVAVSHSACLAHNAVNRVLAYARTGGGAYRLVLDDYGFPENVDASPHGTITLSSHETVTIVDEVTYVWNGRAYELSPEASHRYDVALGEGSSASRALQERPYVVRVRFAPGASSTRLTGSIAGGFGDSYEFDVRAGQTVTVRVDKGRSNDMAIDLYRERPGSLEAIHVPARTTSDGRTSQYAIPSGGTWKLDVSGSDKMNPGVAEPYALTLTIR